MDMTYEIAYQETGMTCGFHYLVGLSSHEEAAWQAKDFCDQFGHKLLDVRPIGDRYDT